MSYEVVITPTAARDLRGLPDDARRRIVERLTALSEDPRPQRSQPLHGDLKGLRRLHVGDSRASYTVGYEARVVRVGGTGHRGVFQKRISHEGV